MLIHYKENGETIKSVDSKISVEILKLVKISDYIIIDGEHYNYTYSEFTPTFDDALVDVLNIHVRALEF